MPDEPFELKGLWAVPATVALAKPPHGEPAAIVGVNQDPAQPDSVVIGISATIPHMGPISLIAGMDYETASKFAGKLIDAIEAVGKSRRKRRRSTGQ